MLMFYRWLQIIYYILIIITYYINIQYFIKTCLFFLDYIHVFFYHVQSNLITWNKNFYFVLF